MSESCSGDQDEKSIPLCSENELGKCETSQKVEDLMPKSTDDSNQEEKRVTFSKEEVEYISLPNENNDSQFMDNFDIDEDIDDAIDEGCMGMECTLERGFSLNESMSSALPCEKKYLDQSIPYIHKNICQRYNPSLKHFIPIRRSPNSKAEREMMVDNAGMLSFISFSWVGNLMWKAYKFGLDEEDIPICSKYDRCKLNTERLGTFWSAEVENKGLKDADLQNAVWRFIRTRIIFSMIIFIATLACGFVGPTIFLRNLIHWLSTEEPLSEGVFWAVGLVLCEFTRVVMFALVWAINHRTAVRLRAACLGLVYKKLMNMSNLGSKSIGEVINLFANDSQRIYDFVILGPMIIGGPIVAIGGFVYIFWLLGSWALLGMLSFLVFYPFQYGISRLTGYFRRKTVIQTDQRVRLMNELLACIKLIKMYAWEGSFTKSICAIRDEERKYLEKSAYVQSLSIAMAPVVPVLAAIVTFLVHIGAGNNLTPAQALSIVAFLLGNVRASLNMMRFSLRAIVEYIESQKRIQSLLLLDEIQDYVQNVESKNAIQLVDVNFAWSAVSVSKEEYSNPKKKQKSKKIKKDENKILLSSEKEKVEVLQDVDISVEKGELIGICGGVGAGKSSLLLGCLGQMQLTKGKVKVSGSFAYVGQQAWILNATLRENIILGEPFNAKRYYKVVHACNLTEDISLLPGGDETEIGERGINLSGGQKQRVSLARSLYANKDIYLLDDCLSAVDTQVGQHIFHWLIKNGLKSKTILFVSHQMQYLPHCDRVILLHDGKVAEMGTHAQLMELQSDYFHLYENHMETLQSSKSAEGCQDKSVKPILSPTNSPINSPDRKVEASLQNKGQLTTEETMEKGKIPSWVYKSYIQYAGGYLVACCVICTFALNVGSTAFSSWWLSYWLNAGSGNTTIEFGNTTVISDSISDNPDVDFYKTVYASVLFVIFGTSLIRGFAFMKVTIRASSKMHSHLFGRILRSPMSFFETTPSGRIINLFSRDIDEVDVRLPYTMESLIQNVWLILASFIFVCLVFPQFLIFLVFLAAFFLFIRNIFSIGVREFKRYENVSRSPLYSHISSTINGLSAIQAYSKQEMFTKKFGLLFDDNSCKYYLFNCAIRWLALRLDILALCCTGVTAFLAIIMRDSVGPAYAGLALAYAAQLSGIFQFTVRLSTETEARFTSVHRIISNIKTLPSEAPAIKSKRPNPHWPKFGRIAFKNVFMQYRSDSPFILRGITFGIDSEEKIGIIGRTGSGKSSLGVALFRLVELESGSIEIDGVDISSIGLLDLRSHLSIIPQDPVLFIGTVRYNLDPFNAYTDDDIWQSLEKTSMKETISGLSGGLLSPVIENGENFSVGERQLLCMSRALLRNSKIIFLDEATAGIDTETDSKIQTTLKEAFVNCTMITVAHRLNTIMTCSRVLVMERGKLVEFDAPKLLLSRPSSTFYKMVQAAESGIKISQ